jgi:hypothetical protein
MQEQRPQLFRPLLSPQQRGLGAQCLISSRLSLFPPASYEEPLHAGTDNQLPESRGWPAGGGGVPLVRHAHQGGFAVTMTGAASVQASGKGFAGQLGIYSDEYIEGPSRSPTKKHLQA